MKSRLAVALAALSSAGLAHAQLMVTDSGAGDRVMLFSSVDGSLIDANWITDLSGAFVFTTPKEANVVGNEIWVSDQVADAIHRFDASRNFLGSITALPAGLPVSNFDNLRGFGVDGGKVYLTLSHTNSAVRGVVTIDAATATSVGFFPIGTNSVFDAEPHQGNLLITNSTTNDLENWTPNGVFNNIFDADVTFPQQVATMRDGSILAVSSIAAAGVEGVYHYNGDGTLKYYLDTQAIKTAVGEIVPRGAWLLDNGSYLITTGDGVFVATVTGPGSLDYTFTTSLLGVDAQYVNAVPEPTSLALGVVGFAAMLRRRR